MRHTHSATYRLLTNPRPLSLAVGFLMTQGAYAEIHQPVDYNNDIEPQSNSSQIGFDGNHIVSPDISFENTSNFSAEGLQSNYSDSTQSFDNNTLDSNPLDTPPLDNNPIDNNPLDNNTLNNNTLDNTFNNGTFDNATFTNNSLAVDNNLLALDNSLNHEVNDNHFNQNNTDITSFNNQNDFNANAEMPSATLDTITTTASSSETNQIGTEVVSNQRITDEVINSNQDLVRYNPEVSVAEVGRYGSKGFSVRGVDGNRVAISVDGVGIPDVEVNEIFTPYGYVNDSRFASDVELMQSVQLKTGADGVSSGSGALGGAVNYKTKEPRDLLHSGNIGGGYIKTGYSTKNQEKMTAIGLAMETERSSGLINYAYREGHELKNHASRRFDKSRLDIDYPFPENEIGTKGIYPDPSHYESHATLAKGYFSPSEEHRIGVHGSFEERENHNLAITKMTFAGQRRLAWDKNQRLTYGASYRYQPYESKFLDKADAKYTHQEVMTLGDTFTYYPKQNSENSYQLAFNEHRPIYQDTDIIDLSAQSLPISLQYGDHVLSTSLRYSRQDYDPYMITKNITDNQITGMFNTIPAPDVKSNILNLAITDDIQVNDKARVSLGLRHDSYTRKPYFRSEKQKDVENMGPDAMLKKLLDNGELDKTTKFSNLSWSLGGAYNFNDQWQGQYKVASGFLAPSINQTYSAFCFLGNCQKPNVHLKPETSINQEVALTGKFDKGSVKMNAFYTKYKDFIDSINYNEKFKGNVIEYVNLENASTKGFGIGGELYLDAWLSPLRDIGLDTGERITLTGQLNYASDSTSRGTNLLATQPLTAIVGLDYQAPDDRYQLHAKTRYIAKKNPKDAMRLQFDGSVSSAINKDIDNRLSSAFVTDIYGNVKLSERLSLQGGVYNLFNQKYITWDNVRQLATIGINNMADGDGIWRYSDPGRNYAVSLNYEF